MPEEASLAALSPVITSSPRKSKVTLGDALNSVRPHVYDHPLHGVFMKIKGDDTSEAFNTKLVLKFC